MKFLDILSMSLGNLWKRKIRTVLTVLGVMIGTASIVTMLSLGIGLKEAMLEEMTGGGAINTVEVSNYGGRNGDDNRMTDEKVASFMDIDHVINAEPILTLSGTVTYKNYESSTQVMGVSQGYLSKIDLAEGAMYPSATGKGLDLLFGNMSAEDFYNKKTQEYLWEMDEDERPELDLTDGHVFLQLESTYTTDADGNDVEQPAKKELVQVVGMTAGGTDKYTPYSYGVYTDIDRLKGYLKANYQVKQIPGQPLTKSGQPYKDLSYNRALVEVDEVANVEDVVKAISDMGYDAYSEAEWIESAKKEMLVLEAVLGGIGAISLIVAAIGIANTMMMSTYERTKEIGVMKVLGCSLQNIRMLFLTEAAFIGAIGGVVGLIVSAILSIFCNVFLSSLFGYEGQNISVIPIWLVFAALVFSILVGMGAGFFPAQRATKLSPLAAIRTE